MKLVINEHQQLLLSLMEDAENEKYKKLANHNKSSSAMAAQRKVVFAFLFHLQQSTLVNMTGAAPFLINGGEWLRSYIITQGKEPHAFTHLIEQAQECRDAVIQIAMSHQEEAGSDEQWVSATAQAMRTIARDLLEVWKGMYPQFKKRFGTAETKNPVEFACKNCSHTWLLEPQQEDCYVCHHCGKNNQED